MTMILFKFWKFFFTAYYVAFELGEKKHPQENALYLMTILYYINSISVINTVRFFIYDRYNDRLYLSIVVFFVVIIILNVLVFNKKNGFKKKINSFAYLASKEVQKRNIINLVISLIFTMIYQAVSWRAVYHWESPFF